MKPLIKAALIASLFVTVPAWAHGGPHRGWDDHRYHHRHWQHGHHKHPGYRHQVREVQRVERVYYEPYPVQSASASPGIHVIFPDVYLPWPK